MARRVDSPASRDRRPRRRGLRFAATSVVFLILAGAAFVFTYRRADEREAPISVRVVATGVDRWVHIDPGEPVASALLEAEVTEADGKLLSITSHRVLDAHHDPAQLTVDGDPTAPASVLIAHQVVRVVDGTDTTEGTETVVDVVPTPPMDAVIRRVHERGSSGRTERVVGQRSGEVVSTRVLVAPVAPKPTTRKVVAFTFDDGPSATWTPVILAMLRAKGVKATFCEIGQEVDANPAMSASVVAGGHRLCNHTQNHDEGMRGAPQARLDAQIGGGADTFARHGLPALAYFRPPGGFLSDAIEATARARGEQTLYWKVDTQDWRKGANALTIAGHLLDEVDPGAIILMHDGGGRDRGATVIALGLIIDHLRAQGYAFTFPIIG